MHALQRRGWQLCSFWKLSSFFFAFIFAPRFASLRLVEGTALQSSLDLSWTPVVVNGSLAPSWYDSEWQAQVLIAPRGIAVEGLRAVFQDDFGLVSFRRAVPVQGVVLLSLTFSAQVRRNHKHAPGLYWQRECQRGDAESTAAAWLKFQLVMKC